MTAGAWQRPDGAGLSVAEPQVRQGDELPRTALQG